MPSCFLLSKILVKFRILRDLLAGVFSNNGFLEQCDQSGKSIGLTQNFLRHSAFTLYGNLQTGLYIRNFGTGTNFPNRHTVWFLSVIDHIVLAKVGCLIHYSTFNPFPTSCEIVTDCRKQLFGRWCRCLPDDLALLDSVCLTKLKFYYGGSLFLRYVLEGFLE